MRAPAAVRFQLDAARRLGLEGRLVDPGCGYLFEIGDGRRWMPMVGGMSAANGAVPARLASDKDYTARLLVRAGFRVPATARCLDRSYFGSDLGGAEFGPGPGLRLAAERGYPLLVKPNRRSHGRGIVRVASDDELERAIAGIWERLDYVALVQEPIPGTDLRLDYLGDEFLLGYERRPVRVEGDGHATLRELLAAALPGSPLPAGLPDDPDWRAAADPLSLEPETVLPAGEAFEIGGTVLNLNRWATARPIFEVPPAWLEHGVAIGRALGLEHFGIDFRGATLDEDPGEAVVIEVNASPLLLRIAELGWREEALAAQAEVLEVAWKRWRARQGAG